MRPCILLAHVSVFCSLTACATLPAQVVQQFGRAVTALQHTADGKLLLAGHDECVS